MRADSTITIKGPGGGINYEFLLIKNALEAAGIKLIVENNYPVEEMFSHTRDWPSISAFMEHRKELSTRLEHTVRVVVDHLPWGG